MRSHLFHRILPACIILTIICWFAPPPFVKIESANASGRYLEFTTQPSSVTAGVPFTVEVTIKNEDGSVDTLATDSIHMSIDSSSGANGDVMGTVDVDAVDGVATFSDLTLQGAEAGLTLSASGGKSFSPVVSAPITILSGDADHLVFTSDPSVSVNQAFSVTVAVKDAFENTVTTDNGRAVTVAIESNPSSGSLSGTVVRNTASGVATFNDLVINAGGSGYSLNAQSPGLAAGTSNSFSVVGSPAKVVISSGDISTQVHGVPFSVSVQVLDANNQLVASDNSTQVSVAIGNNPASGTLSGTIPLTVSGGTATFSDLSINNGGVGYTLVVSSGVLTTSTSNSFNVVGVPHTLEIGTVTGTSDYYGTFSATVTVLDANNLQVSNDNSTSVTVALGSSGSSPGGGTLSGTVTRTVSGGTTTFNDLDINSYGLNYTLTASASGLTSATSNTFNMSGLASRLQFSPSTLSSLAANASSFINIQSIDSNNRTASSTGRTVTVALGDNPAAGTLSGSLSGNIFSIAAAINFAINNPGTGYSLVASAPGLTSTTSNAFNVYGSANKLGIATLANPALGGSFVVTVTVQDSGGRTVENDSGRTVTLAFGENPSGAVLSGNLSVQVSNGVAMFSGLSIDRLGSGFTLVATASGLTSATSNTFDVVHGTATQLVFSSQPSSSRVWSTFSTSVTLQDAEGNTATGASNSVTIALASNPSDASLSGTLTVMPSNGVATFSNLALNAAGTGYTLRATSLGLSSATSNSFNIASLDTNSGRGSSGISVPVVSLAPPPLPTTLQVAPTVFLERLGVLKTQALQILQQVVALSLTQTVFVPVNSPLSTLTTPSTNALPSLMPVSTTPKAVESSADVEPSPLPTSVPAPAPESAATPAVVVVAPTIVTDLSLGSQSEDVRALQNFLVAKSVGPRAEALKVHGTTNIFGPLTAAALAEFQKSVGLPSTGYFGPKTKAFLKK